MDLQPSSSNKENLADKLFLLQINTVLAEETLMIILDSLTFPFDWYDFTYDYFRRSLSIYGVPEIYKLSGNDALKLKNYGFKSVYITSEKNYNNICSFKYYALDTFVPS
jgi:hypothetical protein